jgi:hypothetical protein
MHLFFMTSRKKIKQSQRLKFISAEAKRIRELHEGKEISAAEAARRLVKLRLEPELVFSEQHDQLSSTAA